jgi:glutathione S-transferase
MLRIYGRDNSINVRKALWACAEIGIAYERLDYGRGFKPTDSDEFVAVSRFGVVPVIDDDGFVLRESNTIVRYLAAKHGRQDLYPGDVRRRATIESWMDWASTDLGSAVRDVFWGLQLKHPDFADSERIARGVANLNKQMERLDHHLSQAGPYVMGDTFTVADIPIGLSVNRWFLVAFEKPRLPALTAYFEKLSERPAFRQHGRNGTP